MRIFLENLLSGLSANSLNSKQKEIIRNLEMVGAVSKHKDKFYLNNGFVCGKLDISSAGTGYLAAFDPKFARDLIIENRDIQNAKYGDIVLAKILSQKKSKTRAKVILTIKAAHETAVVFTKKFGKEILGVNVKTGLASNLKASQKSLKTLPMGTLLKIDNLKNEIVEVLGVIDDEKVDEKISLAIYNKNSEFNKICENEARAFGDKIDLSMHKNRVDLTHLDFCTIDPIHAKDFDDAIYFDEKNREIYVAIADVSYYVSAYSGLDKEAKFRGFSIYFPHIAIPMLPRFLSENICSLRPNENRLAYVFKIKIDENLRPSEAKPFEAVINSKRRFNYDEVDKFLAQKSIPAPFEWLLKLHDLTLKLREIRLKKGFDFQTQELRMELDANLALSRTYYERSTPSHALIEDCMLLANEAAAKCIKKGIFRNHGAMDTKKIPPLLDDLTIFGIEENFAGSINEMVAKIQEKADKLGVREEIDKLIIKAQKKAEYASENRGHFGLGFAHYSHFTSPIRRYSDLILHRILKAVMQNDDKMVNYLLLNIDETCANLNELEREADKVAYDFMDRKFARWAAKNIGRAIECYIDNNENEVTAKMDDFIKGGRIFILNFTNDKFTRILVQITEVDIITAKIFGRVVKKIDV